jgi:preprotein translocase subunit SecG
MLSTLFHVLYVPVCIFLILVVLLQTGKRADLAGAFGGGGSQTAFGARGAATLLAKVTTASAVLFMVLALALSIMSSRSGGGGTVLDEVPTSTGQPAPVEAPVDLTQPPPVSEETTMPAEDSDLSLVEEQAPAVDPEATPAPEEDLP